jgi:hypothetical protein
VQIGGVQEALHSRVDDDVDAAAKCHHGQRCVPVLAYLCRWQPQAMVLWLEEVTQWQTYCLERTHILLDDIRHRSQVDHAQSIDQAKYTRGRTVMEQVDTGIPYI